MKKITPDVVEYKMKIVNEEGEEEELQNVRSKSIKLRRCLVVMFER